MAWHQKTYRPEEMEDAKLTKLFGRDFDYARLPIPLQLDWDKQGKFDLDDVASKTEKQRRACQRGEMCRWICRAWNPDPKIADGLLQYLLWHAEAYGEDDPLSCKECCFDLTSRQLWQRGLKLCGIYPDTPLIALQFKTRRGGKESEHARFGKAAAKLLP